NPAANAIGKIVDVTDTLPNGSTLIHHEYRTNGLLRSKTWSGTTSAPFTASATYDYDDAGRLAQLTYPKVADWSNPLVVKYGYDPVNGQVSSIADASNPANPVWRVASRDDRGNVHGESMRVSSTQDVHRVTSYYRSTGLLKSVSFNNATPNDEDFVLGYQYDAGGLPSSLQQFGTSV